MTKGEIGGGVAATSPSAFTGVHWILNNINNKSIEVVQYKVVTVNNLFQQGNQYLEYIDKKDTKELVLRLPSHQGRSNFQSSMSVTGAFREPINRQII